MTVRDDLRKLADEWDTDDYDRCDSVQWFPGISTPNWLWRCVKDAGHEAKHGAAGFFWDDPTITFSGRQGFQCPSE
jgi:hypothetical protein